jgi:ABC-type phosphate/phosphonate transport system permease subunit
MELSYRETITVIHGMVLGALFLLAFGGGLAGLYSLRPRLITAEGIRERTRRLILGTWTMAVVAWATVITGTWQVYPWYRESLAGDDLSGCANATLPTETCSPRDFLTSNVTGDTESWHTFGFEWKEHVAWVAPILATVVAFAVTYYGIHLIKHQRVRRALMVTFVTAFAAAAVAGIFGAFVNKIAPIR